MLLKCEIIWTRNDEVIRLQNISIFLKHPVLSPLFLHSWSYFPFSGYMTKYTLTDDKTRNDFISFSNLGEMLSLQISEHFGGIQFILKYVSKTIFLGMINCYLINSIHFYQPLSSL